MDPNDKKKTPEPAKEEGQASDSWLEDMKDDLEDYMEEQGSQLRY